MFGTVSNRLGNLLHVGAAYQETCERQALRAAIEGGDRTALKRLLARRPALATYADERGATPLHWLMTLLTGGATVSTESRRVMLHCLLDARADPNRADADGRTPLHAGCRSLCEVELLTALLARGASVNAVDRDGRTALHLALAAWRDETVVRALLDHGADPAQVDAKGDSAARLAYSRHWVDPVLIALARRGRPPVPSSQGGGHVGPNGNADRSGPSRDTAPVGPGEWRHTLSALATRCRGPQPMPHAGMFDALRGLAAALREFQQSPPERDGHGAIAEAVDVLLALAPHVDAASLQPCHDAIQALRRAAPDIDDTHRGPMIRLYVELAKLWQRTGHWKEAYCYAFHAHALATQFADGSATGIESMIDRMERAMVRHDLPRWAPVASTRMRAGLFDVGERCVSEDPPLAALREAARLLELAARARPYFDDDHDPGHAVPLPQLRQAIDGVLGGARTASSRVSEFDETAGLVLSLAGSLARLGRAADGAALCEMVVRHHQDEECVGELRGYDCSAHRELAVVLRRAGRPVHEIPPGWRDFRAALGEARARAARVSAALSLPNPADRALAVWDTPLAIERVQEWFSRACAGLIGRIARQCEEWMLCEPPCRYAIVGLGSLGRGDMMPFSDVEYVLLIQQEAAPGSIVEHWFGRYCRLMELAFYSVGESSAGADHPLALARGFERDTSVGGMAAWREWLGTPEQLVARLRQRTVANRRDGIHTDQDIDFSLLSPSVVHGDTDLTTRLAEAMAATLDAPMDDALPPFAARHDIALRQLHADAARLRREWERGVRHVDAIDLKHALAGPLIHALTGVARCYGFADTPPRAMLARLEGARYFSAAFLMDWRWAMATVQTIRFRSQLAGRGRCDSVRPDRLRPQERAALQAVHVRVLRPLWSALSRWMAEHDFPARAEAGAAVLTHLRALDGCDPPLLPFPPLADGSSAAVNTPARGFDIPAVRALVATLVARSSDIATLRHYYGVVIAQGQTERPAAYWAIWRDHLAVLADGAAAIKALAGMPDATGWRAEWSDGRDAFLTKLQYWHAAEIATEWTLHVPGREGRAGRERIALPPAIAAQLFDASGMPLTMPAGSAASVPGLPVRFQTDDGVACMRVRFCPGNPWAELASHALQCRVAGAGGMPFGIMACLRARGRSFAVLIGEDVQGPTLASQLMENAAALRAIGMASFTRALLRVLLTDPADDTAERYVLTPASSDALALLRVGPERALPGGLCWPPDRDATGSDSVLYCLDQMMAPLDAGMIAELRGLDGAALLDAWLDDMEEEQRPDSGFFSTDDIAAAFQSASLPVVLVSVIADEGRQRLLSRLDIMQGLADLAACHGVGLTGMDLLKAMRPDIAARYVEGFMRYPVDAAHSTVAARVAWQHGRAGAGADIGSPSRSGLSVAPARSSPPRVLVTRVALDRYMHDLWRGAARRTPLVSRDLCQLAAAVLRGEQLAERGFESLSAAQRAAIAGFSADAMRSGAWRPTVEEQQRLLLALIGTPLSVLDLQPFAAVLDDELLRGLLRGSNRQLRELDISGCDRLTQRALSLIEMYAQELQTLVMRGLRFAMPDAPAAPAGRQRFALRLHALQSLDLSRNPTLVELRLQTPALRHLSLRGCRQLRDIAVGNAALRELDARGCTALPESALQALAGARGALERARLMGCQRLRHIEWRERFPWLLDFAWDGWPEQQIATLMGLLSQHDGAPLPDAPHPAKAAVRAWLRTRARALDVLRRFERDPAVSAPLRALATTALDRAYTANPDGSVGEAVATLTGLHDDRSPAMAEIMLSALRADAEESMQLVAIETLSRLIALPAPAQVARWRQPH